MRILVTGGTGFVGRHLLPELEARGHALTLALRTEASSRGLPGTRLQSERRSVVVGQIGEGTDWREALEGNEAVIHLAARAHVLGEDADVEEPFMRVNAHGTRRLVDQAIDTGVSRFLLMSSIGAVTASSDTLVTLDTPCAPETPYGRSKFAAEQALVERARGTQTSWTILRPTLVYGPGNPGNMERLVALVKRGLPLPLGALHNRRSFTFVENLVQATATALRHPEASNSVFLVADGQDLSTPDLIRRIAAIAGTGTLLLKVPMPAIRGLARGAEVFMATTGLSVPFDTETLQRLESSLYVDIEPLRAKLGWTPAFSIDEGLRCMLTQS